LARDGDDWLVSTEQEVLRTKVLIIALPVN